MSSHKHENEGGTVKGWISQISLLNSFWDAQVLSPLHSKVYHKVQKGRGETELGGSEGAGASGMGRGGSALLK